jgi:general secretion pathway protein J
MTMRRRAQAGFTLVEVMVALMIFAMIAAAGVAILAFSVRAQGATTAALDDMGAVNRLSAIMTADLAQARDRPTRDEAGALLPAFTGTASGVPLIRLVRGGWDNVDAAPRASLQKVEYRLTSGGIERVAYPALDGAAPLPPALLLDHVTAVQLRYRYAGAWSDRWDGNPQASLPQAVELVATRDTGATYRMLFVVGTGAPRARATAGAPNPGPTNAAP